MHLGPRGTQKNTSTCNPEFKKQKLVHSCALLSLSFSLALPLIPTSLYARFQGRSPFQLYSGPEDARRPTKATAKRLYGIVNTVTPPSQKHKYILESNQEDGPKSGLLTEDRGRIQTRLDETVPFEAAAL